MFALPEARATTIPASQQQRPRPRTRAIIEPHARYRDFRQAPGPVLPPPPPHMPHHTPLRCGRAHLSRLARKARRTGAIRNEKGETYPTIHVGNI
eukprot:scaffold5498_cov102-Isochrysis_galbana.AAC.4